MTYQEIREAAENRFQTLLPEEYNEIAVPIRKNLVILADGRRRYLTDAYLENHEPYRSAFRNLRALTEGEPRDVALRAVLSANENRPVKEAIDGRRKHALLFAIALLVLHIAANVMMVVFAAIQKRLSVPVILCAIVAGVSYLFILEFIRAGQYKRRLAYANTPQWFEKEFHTLVAKLVSEREYDLCMPEANRASAEYISPIKRWKEQKAEIRKHPEKAWTLKTFDPGTGEPPTTEMLKAEAERRFAALTNEEYEKRAAPIRTMLTTNQAMEGGRGFKHMTKEDRHAFVYTISRLSLNLEKELSMPIPESDLNVFEMTADDLRKGNKAPFAKKYRALTIRLCAVLLICGALIALAVWIEPKNRTVSVILITLSATGLISSVIMLLRVLLNWISGTIAMNKETKMFVDPSFWEAEIETEVERMIINRENEIIRSQKEIP